MVLLQNLPLFFCNAKNTKKKQWEKEIRSLLSDVYTFIKSKYTHSFTSHRLKYSNCISVWDYNCRQWWFGEKLNQFVGNKLLHPFYNLLFLLWKLRYLFAILNFNSNVVDRWKSPAALVVNKFMNWEVCIYILKQWPQKRVQNTLNVNSNRKKWPANQLELQESLLEYTMLSHGVRCSMLDSINYIAINAIH